MFILVSSSCNFVIVLLSKSVDNKCLNMNTILNFGKAGFLGYEHYRHCGVVCYNVLQGLLSFFHLYIYKNKQIQYWFIPVFITSMFPCNSSNEILNSLLKGSLVTWPWKTVLGIRSCNCLVRGECYNNQIHTFIIYPFTTNLFYCSLIGCDVYITLPNRHLFMLQK